MIGGCTDYGTGNTYGGTTAGLGNVISGNEDRRTHRDRKHHDRGQLCRHGRDRQCRPGQRVGELPGSTVRTASATSISTTITNNVVSGNASGIDRCQTARQSQSILHDRQQPDRDQRRRDRGAGERWVSGLELESVENATVLNNVISGNNVGVELTGFGPDVRTQRVPGEPDRHRQDGPGRARQHELGNRHLDRHRQHDRRNGPGQGNVIAFNGGDGIDVAGASRTSSPRTRSSATRRRASRWRRARRTVLPLRRC